MERSLAPYSYCKSNVRTNVRTNVKTKLKVVGSGRGKHLYQAPTMEMRVEPELVGNAEDYKPFSQEFLQRHPSVILKATMDIVSCHTADAFSAVLSILCEKYGHDLDEVIETIKAHDTWKSLTTHPLVKSLTYFNEDDVCDMKAGRDMSGNVWAGMPSAAVGTPPPTKRRKVGTKTKASDVAADDAIAKLEAKLAKTAISGGDGAGVNEFLPAATTVVAPAKKVILKKKAAPSV